MKDREDIDSEKDANGNERLRVLERQSDAILADINSRRAAETKKGEESSGLNSNVISYIKQKDYEQKKHSTQRYPLMIYVAGIAFMLFFLIGVFGFIFSPAMPSASGSYREVIGVVQSSGLIFVGTGSSGSKGNAVVAVVKVPDGGLISIRVKSNTPIQAGVHVHLREYSTGAYELSDEL